MELNDQRSSVETGLRIAEDNYRNVLAYGVVGICQATPGGIIRSVNSALAQVCGYESPEDPMANVTDFRRQLTVDLNERPETRRLVDEHGSVSGLEQRIFRKNGIAIWVSATFRPVSNDNTSLFCYEGFLSNITDHKQAEQAIDATWRDYREKNGRKALDRYVLSVAQDCSDLYRELAEREAADVEGQLNPQGTLTAAALRSYATRTGDYGEVANYLVYYYPYGKDLFQPNEDGDLLGQLIVEAGATGLRGWSDEAIYAIANGHYWQYNPPATRLVFAEYQRRMRMMCQTEAESGMDSSTDRFDSVFVH